MVWNARGSAVSRVSTFYLLPVVDRIAFTNQHVISSSPQLDAARVLPATSARACRRHSLDVFSLSLSLSLSLYEWIVGNRIRRGSGDGGVRPRKVLARFGQSSMSNLPGRRIDWRPAGSGWTGRRRLVTSLVFSLLRSLSVRVCYAMWDAETSTRYVVLTWALHRLVHFLKHLRSVQILVRTVVWIC